MLRLMLAATLMTTTAAMASTWPDADWPYAEPQIANSEDLTIFKTAKECAGQTDAGDRVFIVDGSNFAVFTVSKDGMVRRAYNAYAQRYSIDFCAELKTQ